jgi:hypothetical protein
MKQIEITERVDCEHLVRTIPKPEQFKTLITEDSIIKFKGQPIAVYVNTPKHLLKGMRQIARTTKFAKTSRTWGLPTQSSVFGSLPRNPLRNDKCRFSKQTQDERKNFLDSFDFANYVAEIYKTHLPEAYEFNRKVIAENINSDWLPNDSPFTTCNFNINHAIKHHRDTGNFKNIFSNVLILKEGVVGGYLVFPELNIALEQSDGALGIFDGQKWMHGVMPLSRISKDGYRASVVFYALDGMKKCYPYKKEAERFAKIKTTRAQQRATGNAALRKMTKK